MYVSRFISTVGVAGGGWDSLIQGIIGWLARNGTANPTFTTCPVPKAYPFLSHLAAALERGADVQGDMADPSGTGGPEHLTLRVPGGTVARDSALPNARLSIRRMNSRATSLSCGHPWPHQKCLMTLQYSYGIPTAKRVSMGSAGRRLSPRPLRGPRVQVKPAEHLSQEWSGLCPGDPGETACNL